MAYRFDAGRLRHRLTIRRVIETSNGKGGYTTQWNDLAIVRAEVAGLDAQGREGIIGQALQGIATFRIRIRWRSDIMDSDQLRAFDGCFGRPNDGADHVDVNIRTIVDPDGLRRQLIIIADTASTRS
jgi:SPP1 family predicted phage head-tail adaptor